MGAATAQLAVVLLALGLMRVGRRWAQRPPAWMAVRVAAAYVIGTFAAYWCWDRATWLWL